MYIFTDEITPTLHENFFFLFKAQISKNSVLMNFFCVLIFKDACTHKIFFSLSSIFLALLPLLLELEFMKRHLAKTKKKNIKDPNRRGSEKLINLSEEKDKKGKEGKGQTRGLRPNSEVLTCAGAIIPDVSGEGVLNIPYCYALEPVFLLVGWSSGQNSTSPLIHFFFFPRASLVKQNL